MVEYGALTLLKEREKKSPLVIFGIAFGDSHLDYEPNSKLKVPQMICLFFLDKCL